MMDDRTLLERAAKAAGYTFVWRGNSGGFWWHVDPDTARPWNPLTDDGDALRLAVRKCFHVRVFAASDTDGIKSPGFVEVWQDGDSDPLVMQYVDGNDYEDATRRAIVRAAASMVGE